MENREILFGLHETPGIGWQTIKNILGRCKDLNQLSLMGVADIEALHVPKNKIALVYQACAPVFIEQRRELYERAGYQVITLYDPGYPKLLRESAQAPWLLYVKGDVSLWKSPMIAMVGTRIPTTYGKRTAFQLAQGLSANGICVVSGLARGIDSESHLGALGEKGSTIAVLGTALNEVYPRENARLMERIAEEGVLISEYPLGTPSHPGLFPLRNRIIAGLASGVVVVEADSKSGSLITAYQALDDNREVYAVPGPISSPKSRGTHELIKVGSQVLTCVEDIIGDFKEGRLPQLSSVRYQATRESIEFMTKDELYMLQYMSVEPISIDLLMEQCGFEFGHFHSVLLSLLMKKKIEQQFGSSYNLIY